MRIEQIEKQNLPEASNQKTKQLIDKNGKILQLGDEVIFFGQNINPKLYLGNEWLLNKGDIATIESSFTLNHLMRVPKNMEIISNIFDDCELWNEYVMPDLTVRKLINKIPHNIEK